MSQLRLNKGAAPSNPSANKAGLYYDQAAPGVGTTIKPVIIDESGNKLVLGGLAIPDYRLIKVTEIFQGTVTYTPSNGVRALFVECIGGGGSGGGVATAVTNSGAAGGGGGGGYSCLWVTGTIKASYTVQVGAGGAAPAAGANNGNVGTDTTFDSPSICTAKGGAGGIADTVAAGPRVAGLGGAGGAAASGVGDLKFSGGPGGPGLALAAAQAISGDGGHGGFGAGSAIGVKAQGNGTAAGGTGGAGGSGACILSGGASVAGGAGANGIIRVWEFA